MELSIKDIKTLEPAALQQKLVEARAELRKLRVRVFGGELKQVRQVRKVRQTVARLMTYLNKTK